MHNRYYSLVSKSRIIHVCACILLIVLMLVAFAAVCAAADYTELGIQTGHGSLFDPQPDYGFTELTLTYGYHADDWIKDHLNANPPGDWDFRISPALAIVAEPKAGVEVSCGFGFKVSTPVGKRLRPGFFASTGPMYTTVDTKEQSTRFNFATYAGLNLEYKIDETQSVSLFKLIRHFSNGGVKEPNDGVNTNSWGIEYTWYH
jgi:hypothetical protein